MVVKASNGNTVDIDLNVRDYITPEHNYTVMKNICTIEEEREEVDKWWEHLVLVLEDVL